MKIITVSVSKPVYQDFQSYAEKTERKTSELAREVREIYRQTHMQRKTSLRDLPFISVGGPIIPITGGTIF